MVNLPKDAERLVDPLYTFLARSWTTLPPHLYVAAADNIAAEIKAEDDPDAIPVMAAAEAYLRKRGQKMNAALKEAFEVKKVIDNG